MDLYAALKRRSSTVLHASSRRWKRCATQNPTVAARMRAAPFQIKIKVKGVGPLDSARGKQECPTHTSVCVPEDFHRFIFFDVRMTLLPVLGKANVDKGDSAGNLATAEQQVPHRAFARFGMTKLNGRGRG